MIRVEIFYISKKGVLEVVEVFVTERLLLIQVSSLSEMDYLV